MDQSSELKLSHEKQQKILQIALNNYKIKENEFKGQTAQTNKKLLEIQEKESALRREQLQFSMERATFARL